MTLRTKAAAVALAAGLLMAPMAAIVTPAASYGAPDEAVTRAADWLGQQFTDINGMADSAVGGSMSTLDPQLGSGYKPASAATAYSVNANAFGANQTVFSSGGTQQGAQAAPATSVQPQASQQAQPTQTEPQSFTAWASSLFN